MAYHQSSRLTTTGILALALLSSALFSGCTERPEKEVSPQDPIQLTIAIRSWQQSKTEPMVRAMQHSGEATSSRLVFLVAFLAQQLGEFVTMLSGQGEI